MEKITYREVNGYIIPNLKLPPEEANIRLGKWGAGVRWTPLRSRSTDQAGRRDMMHKDYLLKNKPVTVTIMTSEGRFWQYLADIDIQAQQMFDILFQQMKQAENVTEQLKAENQILWVQKMNSIQSRVTEIIEIELIFV